MERAFLSWVAVVLVFACIVLGCGGGASTQQQPDGGAGGNDTTAMTASSGGSGTGGSGGGGGSAPLLDLFVDALGGADTNPGTQEMRFKTLKHALSVATSGQTVHLYPGTYDANNGEAFPEEVPDGVAIDAVVAGDAVVMGQGETGLAFAGTSTLRYLRLQGFNVAVWAMSGNVTVEATKFLSDNTGVLLSGGARASLKSCEIADGSEAFSVDAAAEFVMLGGEIRDLGPDCSGGVGVGYAGEASSVTLDAVNVHDIEGPLDVRGASKVTIKNSTLKNVGGSGGCAEPMIWISDSPSLHVEGTNMSEVSYTAIYVNGAGAKVTILNGSIVALESATEAIDVGADAQVDVEGTTIWQYGKSVASGVYVASPGASVTLTNAEIDSAAFIHGVWVAQGTVTLRGTTIGHAQWGIRVSGGSLDLGTMGDPGGNTLQTNTYSALEVDQAAMTVVNAAGNTWVPLTQGADASGHYASGVIMGPFGLSAPAPRNFEIAAGSKVVR